MTMMMRCGLLRRAALRPSFGPRLSRLLQTWTLDAPSWGLPLPQGVLGTVTSLLCQEGSRVYAEEIVAVIETDKVSVDVKAQRSGVVTAVLVECGDEVKVRQPLYSVDTHAQLPLPGSANHNAERHWARLREIELEKEQQESERLWREQQQSARRERASGRSPRGEWSWRWQDSARPRQTGGEPGSWSSHSWSHSSRRQSRQQRTRWPRERGPSSSDRLNGSDVLAMPISDLIERVIDRAAEPYACLGLPQGAATSSVRKRYLALALRLHPDKAADQPRAREAFSAMDSAFRTLKVGSRW